MPGFAQTALSVTMVIGPVVGYIDQYFLIKRKQSSVGFNAMTCAILLFANDLRSSFSSSSIEEELIAEENGVIRGTKPWWRQRFWSWDHYLDYINCLLGFTTFIAFLYMLLRQYPAFIETLGALSLGIESTLPLPQCISNYKNKSTSGFSLIVLGSWFLGDGFKLFYFIFTKAPLQFIICGAIQLSVDSLIVMQFILYSTFIKNKFNKTSLQTDQDNNCKLIM
ncbi:PQ loop repeat-domain-containing protein [Pilaira anomala]|nr:PQ loop repeat-domain-containing protein [Pilaira anomala]